MTPPEATRAIVATVLRDDGYLRQRRQPQPGDATYLHLRDLLTFLEAHRSDEPLRLLDYGCGGSPYRSLFPRARYCRADYAEASGLDLLLDEQGHVPAPAASFDLILSNQVLEHVPAPADYLHECHRLLVPGGRLLLTTHGFYEEHGCPGDYHRWTSEGLRRAIAAAGLEVLEVKKLTCNARALVQLLSHHHGALFGPRWHPFGLAAAGLRAVFRHTQGFTHRCMDRFHLHSAVVPAEAEGHALFLGLGVCAVKSMSGTR